MLDEVGLHGELMPSVNRMFEEAGLYAGVCAPLQVAASAMLALHRSKEGEPRGATYAGVPVVPHAAPEAALAADPLGKGREPGAAEDEEQDGMAGSAAVEL